MNFISLSILAVALVLAFALRLLRIVPERSAWVVERLGRYDRTLGAGIHLVVPFLDRIVARHSLKEQTLDIPAHACITRDNVRVHVDGVLYLQVHEPERASYGVDDYGFALSQMAQTTLRSQIGKLELDRTLEDRDTLNERVRADLDEACEPWGVRLLRYEITAIEPPADVLEAMEKQMRAERERRAVVLQSEAERTRRSNEAQGEADAIRAIADATAEGLERVARALGSENGDEALRLRVAEQWTREFGRIVEGSNTLVIPADVADLASMIKLATHVAAPVDSEGPGLRAAGA